MTHEESLMMWKLEMENFNKNIGLASKDMKKMYSILDTVINEGIVTYEDFTNDMIDELTDRKSTRLNSSHSAKSRMPSSA